MGTLEAFTALDLGELYYLADRVIVERGLHYFRSFAVEGLSWDGREKKIIAVVSGSARHPYEVWLRLRGGRVAHECSCPAWSSAGHCKHGVAALAGVFAALHGFKGGARELPEDYLVELRRGLGLSAGGQVAASVEEESVATVFKVIELSSYGGLYFRVLGPVPHALLESAGVMMPSRYGGQGISREFYLGDVGHRFGEFLERSAAAGIPMVYRGCEGEVVLKLSNVPCRAVMEFSAEGQRVLRRLCFYTKADERLDVEVGIGGRFVLTSEGRVYPVANVDDFEADRLADLETQRYDIDAFNRNVAMGAGLTRKGLDASRFLKEGKRVKPLSYKADKVELGLNCSILKNAAGEPETLQFACTARVGGARVDLGRWQAGALNPLLVSYTGGLLGAKRRVRAMMDLIRRFLAEFTPGRRWDAAVYRSEFAELFEPDYRKVVQAILEGLADLLSADSAAVGSLAYDPEGQRFCRYAIEVKTLLMLLFSMSEADTRRGLHELREGGLTIRRGSSGSEVLRRVMTTAQALGVAVTVDELPVRSVPLSISVDIRASGSDIDWFALHPSIACGDRTIRPEEWQQLIRGELLLRAEDGGLVFPEPGEGGVAGLKALAQMLRVEGKRAVKGPAAAASPHVSRLEMLDWIALRRHGVRVELPREVEALFDSLLQFRELPKFEVPEGCEARLRAYQKQGCGWIDFLYRHRFGACLADDMGLGKTVQAIAFIVRCLEQDLAAGECPPVLIVLPPSLVFNWTDEWARFAPGVKICACQQKADWEAALEEAQVILTTYDRVRLDIKQLEAVRFPIVVFDEAHNLKNISASRTRAAARLNRRFTLCLTGTPVENNASEFYSVLSAAVPGIFGTHKEFQEAFRKDPERILGRSRPFVLRRTKTALLKELPKKEEHVLQLEMSPLQKEIYTRTVSEVKSEIAEAYADRPEQQAGIVALAAILRLRQVCVSPALLGKALPEPAPKFAYMADKLEELAAEGHAALVFSQFIGGLDGLEAVARERGLAYLRMDGRLPVSKRKGVVDAFQSPDGPPFFFISLKTGGVGLNLTRANYVFHLDPWWNPAVENQATDRAHRIGQKRAVFVERLIMRHSIEARMMELKDRKAELFRQLIEQPGAKTARAGLSRKDFEYLLEG